MVIKSNLPKKTNSVLNGFNDVCQENFLSSTGALDTTIKSNFIGDDICCCARDTLKLDCPRELDLGIFNGILN
jgi:hypothetical protein